MFGQDLNSAGEAEAAIAAARTAIAALQAIDLGPVALVDRVDLIRSIHGLVDQTAALKTTAVDQMDRLGVWQAERATSPASWLRCRTLRPRAEASASVRRARGLRSTPKLASSFDEGRIGEARVDAVLRVRNDRTEELFARDEDLLVDLAERLRFDHLVDALQRWAQLADPDGPDPDAAQRDARFFSHSQLLDGAWVSDGRWDAVAGAEIDGAVAAEYDRLFAADWAEASARLGRDPLAEELGRTPGQRRADALLALVRRGHGGSCEAPRPLINIVVGLETLTGPVAELLDGTIISPGTVARHVLDGHLRSLVFDGPDRVVSMSSKQRFFTGALRDAIELRDRECQHPLCDAAVRRCEVDHVVPWPDGPTSEGNGQLLCGAHNRMKGRQRGERRRSAGREPPDH